jgi:sucrose phosphorylase
VKIVRLDAVGYVIKKPGTSCFFVEPEIYDFMGWIQGEAHVVGIELLPEVHAHYSLQSRLSDKGFWVYNFVLPLLILHTLIERSGRALQEHLISCPRRQFTMLDCHDGIPVLPDIEGILEIDQARKVVDTCLQRGANISRIFSAQHKPPQGFDAHQINCTYFSALGSDEDAYLAARAIQFFSPGVPQVYYVGLLGGENDPAEVERSGERRAIHRHNYSVEEVEAAVQKPVVQRLLKLIRFRNKCQAFQGDFEVLETDDRQLGLCWKKGDEKCLLRVDLNSLRSVIEYSDINGVRWEYQP